MPRRREANRRKPKRAASRRRRTRARWTAGGAQLQAPRQGRATRSAPPRSRRREQPKRPPRQTRDFSAQRKAASRRRDAGALRSAEGPQGSAALRDPSSTARAGCTGICGSSTKARSHPGRCPRACPRRPARTASPPHTEDHPLEYLDFHGEIPKGITAPGQMKIWDQRHLRVLKWEPRKVEVALDGERLQGRYALFAIDRRAPPKDWLIHRMDPAGRPGARARCPTHRADARRTRALSRPERSRWAFEIKWDGVRAIAYCAPARSGSKAAT